VIVEPGPSIEFKRDALHFSVGRYPMKEKIMMALAVALFSMVPVIQLITVV